MYNFLHSTSVPVWSKWREPRYLPHYPFELSEMIQIESTFVIVF